MKNLFTPSIILLLFIQTVKAQSTSKRSIDKGDITLTPSVGFPNFLAISLKNTYELSDQKKDLLRIRKSIPIGMIASYHIGNNLSVGGEISYESSQIKWRENETLVGNDSTSIKGDHYYLLNASRIRFLVLLDYHFIIRKKSDWYFGFGLGYSHNPIKLETDATSTSNVSPCFFPVTAKTKIGFNYYLARSIAINAEAGIGGPLLSIGMTIKF
jgi:hypothetical protein